jgi:hypothetical protein
MIIRKSKCIIRIPMKSIYTFLFFLFFSFPILCDSYFISSSIGSDSNNGKYPNAFKKGFGPFASFKKFSEESFFKPGDKIFLKCGDKWKNLSDIRFRFSGEKENPILISSYGEGAKPEIYFSSEVAAFHIHNYSKLIEFITIENISLVGNKNGWGVFISDDKNGGKTKNIKLNNLQISNFKIGIHTQSTSDLQIENSEIYNMEEMGILGGVRESGLIIKNNMIHSNGFNCPRIANIYCHNVYLSFGENILIENNKIYDGSNFGIIIHGNVRNLLINQNELFKNNNAIGVDPGYPERAEGFYDIIISNNRIHNHKGTWILSFQSIHNLLFSNNIIYDEPNFSIIIRKKKPDDAPLFNAVFKNNIFIGNFKNFFSFDNKEDENSIIMENNKLEISE